MQTELGLQVKVRHAYPPQTYLCVCVPVFIEWLLYAQHCYVLGMLWETKPLVRRGYLLVLTSEAYQRMAAPLGHCLVVA